ncbi:MAG: transposase [Sutterellaceae bacterium]|nr:transposase [Sutterellaceae bacterium]
MARSKVVQRFGRLDQMKPAEFEALKAKYKQESATKAAATQAARSEVAQTLLSIQAQSANRPKSARLNYGYYALKTLWEELRLPAKIRHLQAKTRIHTDLNAVISFLAFRKVLDPASIYRSFQQKDSYLGNPAGKDNLTSYYSAYDFLKENKQALLKYVNKRMDETYGKERATLVFYDVTNTYFETPLTDAEKELEQEDYAERFIEAAEMLRDSGELDPGLWNEKGVLDVEKLPTEAIEQIAALKLQYLRNRGPSKEHRADLPIVSIVMVIDKFGFPMDFEVFSGNTSEFKSMRPMIMAWKKLYNIKEAIVFADRGINSADNLEMLRSLDLGFLVAQKVTQFSSTIEKKLFEEDQYLPINPDNPEAGRYRMIKDWTKGRGDKAVKCTLVLTWNAKRAKRDNAILDALVRMIEAKKERGEKIGKSRSGWAQLVKTDKNVEMPILGVDEEILAKKRRFAGYAALVYSAAGPQKDETETETNKKETSADDEMPFPIVGTYKKLTEIELCFRIMKSNLGLRPMYVWTSDHIRAHILVIFLALLLVRLVQDRLEKANVHLSIDEICDALRDAEVAAVYNPATDSYIYLPTAHRDTNRKLAPWASDARLKAKLEAGELPVRDAGDTILQACGLKPVPALCSRSELARCLGTRFATDADAIPEMIRQQDKKASL